MLVYVKNKDGSPLMPCKPAKAKHLLKAGKAKVFKLKPFTIQLKWDCEANVVDVTCGIDKGAKQTGIACCSNGKVLFAANIKHRSDVTEKMTQRRECRKQRRARLWYRKKRFNNRASSRRKDRLPPTIETNINEVIRVVKRIPLPISFIVVEDVMTDIRRLSDKNVKKTQYQESNRLDENLRLATFEFRKKNGFSKEHFLDAVCVACLFKGEAPPLSPRVRGERGGASTDNLYFITFRPRQVRQKYHVLPQKGKGRVLYQRNESLLGFQKGDIVKVKGFIKQVNSIYSTGMLAFRRVFGEPYASVPKNCKLLEKNKTINYWNTTL